METIVTQADLRAAIVQLELKQETERLLLKEQALLTYESIKPINLIRNLFRESAESDELKGYFLNSSIGISAGYLSKFLFQGISGNPIRKILGTAIMFGIKNLVAHNPETVKKMVRTVISIMTRFSRKKDIKGQMDEPLEAPGQ